MQHPTRPYRTRHILSKSTERFLSLVRLKKTAKTSQSIYTSPSAYTAQQHAASTMLLAQRYCARNNSKLISAVAIGDSGKHQRHAYVFPDSVRQTDGLVSVPPCTSTKTTRRARQSTRHEATQHFSIRRRC